MEFCYTPDLQDLEPVVQRLDGTTGRAVARMLIGGGGGCIFIYSCFARQISQIDQFEFDLKRNSSGRT